VRRSLLLLGLVVALGAGAPAAENRNVSGPDQAPLLREVDPFVANISVRNPHDRAVKVKLLDPTCTCATLQIADSFLLPKASTTLTIAVDNHNRSGLIRIGVSIYLTDPDLEAIEAEVHWKVRPCVQVDAIGPGMDPLVRPEDRAWQDIYRYVTRVRPDEPNRLRKRLRLSCPPEEVPPGGLQVLGIDYPGTLWRFTPTAQADGSWLVTASAQGGDEAVLPVGEFKEKVVVRTNHPDKARVELDFNTQVAKDVGEKPLER
jgi:hypothetical protein